ncbi:MAG TPA: lipopolysaccharide biosynthesis protein [Pyrinomonadaceae bacterium]|nr:lipopolysaccharide biosynthesis protein [Pyrinomonadaceae bacterium]
MSLLHITEGSSEEIITDPADPTNLTLTKRVRAGLGWIISSTLIGELVRFARSLVLARLLLPEDFGLFGMALTIVAALNALTTLGLDQTIVATKFANRDELKINLDTVWSTELIRSLIITILVVASAFPIARFYGQPGLLPIIPVLGLTVLIQGFQNIGLALLRKEISFARIFWYELVTNVAGIVVTVALAVVWRNVWALVLSLVVTNLLGTVLSYVFHSYRPRFAFEKTALTRVLHIGKFVLVIAVASYITTMADNIMVGRLLGTGALGNYSLAYNIASAPVAVLVYALSRVLFPAYAEITADHPKRLEQAFTKVFTVSAFILLTITVPLLLLGRELVQLFFGTRWTSAGIVLSILALTIPLRGLTLIMSNVSVSLNRQRDLAPGRVVEALVFLVLLYPLVRILGLTGAAWAVVIVYVLACVNRVIALNKIIPGIWEKLIRVSFSGVTAAVAGWLVGSLALNALSSPLPRLVLGGLLLSLIPALILLLIQTELRRWLLEWFS